MTTTMAQPGQGEPASTDGGSAKKQEILAGARQVFRSEGFDGASMDKIAQAAGVSKGTLYVYFRNKEELFLELVAVDKREAAEQMCRFDGADADVADVLQRLGESFVAMMTRREHIALIRMVIGASEKFPAAGRTFYENGPVYGVQRLAGYLRQQVEAGRLVIDDDVELAAVHFFNLSQGELVKPLLFGHDREPDPDEIRRTVASAVRIFMQVYGPRH